MPLFSSPSLLPRSLLRRCSSPIISNSQGARRIRTCRCGCQSLRGCSCTCCAHLFSKNTVSAGTTTARCSPSINTQTRGTAPAISQHTHGFSKIPIRELSTSSIPGIRIPSQPRSTSTIHQPPTRNYSTMAQEYKLEGISSFADLSPNEKIECEVQGIDDGKVLVLKYGQDHVHAISPRCTHYGAPLKLGVVAPEGRITCAWHGGMSFLLSLFLLGASIGRGGIFRRRDT